MRAWTACLVLGAGVAVFAGCAAPEKTATTTLKLASTEDGKQLVLKGSPLNAAYEGRYSNVDKVSGMTVTVGKGGHLTASCMREGTSIACPEHPFLALPTRISTDRVRIVVMDLNGQKVAEETQDCASSDSECPGEGSGTSDGPSGSGAGGGDGNQSGGTGDGTTNGGDNGGDCSCDEEGEGGYGNGSGSGSSSGGNSKDGTSSTCYKEGRDRYCQGINEWLKAHGLPQRINCEDLDKPVPSGSPKPNAPDRACREIQEEAYARLQADADKCDPLDDRDSELKFTAKALLMGLGVCDSSPLVIDLDGDGVHLSSLADGVSFDLLSTGTPVKTAWTDGKDAFLALDRNENGSIDGSSELFGDYSGGHDNADGFAALAELDDNGDGVIDRKDRVFSHLLVWRDANRDGVSTPNELSPLAETGIRRIELAATRISGPSSLDQHGNSIRLTSSVTWADGRKGTIVDAYFRFQSR